MHKHAPTTPQHAYGRGWIGKTSRGHSPGTNCRPRLTRVRKHTVYLPNRVKAQSMPSPLLEGVSYSHATHQLTLGDGHAHTCTTG